MHVIRFTHPVAIARGFCVAPGRYLADNVNVGAWLAKHSTTAVVEGSPELPAWTPAARRICVVRPGGLGDLTMLTAVFREIVRRAPEARVTVCTYPWNACVLRGLTYVHQVIDYPLHRDRWMDFDAIVALDDLLECQPRPAQTHALDAMLLGFPGLEVAVADRRPDYALGREEVVAALKRWGRPETKPGGLVMGLQLQASAKARTYPRAEELMHAIIARGHGLRIFGEGGRRHVQHEWKQQCHDLPGGEPCGQAPDFRESVVLAADCDVLIAPDSSLVHVAGALGIPCVALYGSFAAQTRVAYYPSVRALQGRAACAPCCWHSRQGHWPKFAQAECLRTDHCTALWRIEPRQVVALAERQASEGKKHYLGLSQAER